MINASISHHLLIAFLWTSHLTTLASALTLTLPSLNTTTTTNPIYIEDDVCVALPSWQNPGAHTGTEPPLTAQNCEDSLNKLHNSVGRDEYWANRLFLGHQAAATPEEEMTAVRTPESWQGKRRKYHISLSPSAFPLRTLASDLFQRPSYERLLMLHACGEGPC